VPAPLRIPVREAAPARHGGGAQLDHRNSGGRSENDEALASHPGHLVNAHTKRSSSSVSIYGVLRQPSRDRLLDGVDGKGNPASVIASASRA
jgi:hypothetical protein